MPSFNGTGYSSHADPTNALAPFLHALLSHPPILFPLPRKRHEYFYFLLSLCSRLPLPGLAPGSSASISRIPTHGLWLWPALAFTTLLSQLEGTYVIFKRVGKATQYRRPGLSLCLYFTPVPAAALFGCCTTAHLLTHRKVYRAHPRRT